MTKDEILKAEWINLGRWVQPTISGCFWTHWCEAKSAQELLLGYSPSQLLFLDGHTLLLKKDQKTIAGRVQEMYTNNTLASFCDRFESIAQQTEATHLRLLDTVGLSDLAYARELVRTYRETTGVWVYAILIAIEAEHLAKSRDLVRSDEGLLEKMRPFMRTTWLEEQAQDVVRIRSILHARYDPAQVTQILQNPEVATTLKRHVELFSWFGTHHWNGEGYTIEKLLEDIFASVSDTHQDANEIARSEPDRTETHALWRLLALCAYWRTHCAEVTAKVVFLSRGRLANAAKHWNIDYEEFTYLSATEVLGGLASGRFVLPEHYAERKNAYGCYIDGEGEHVVTNSTLSEFMNVLVKEIDYSHVKEIRGVVASKGGVVRGLARTILSPKDFEKFQSGEVLIVPETTPDFVPLMKIAAAIVTEVGGITSHAAIVSRELKKPCIIGTKIATQVLKDGDVVEVDAEKGVVIKLN